MKKRILALVLAAITLVGLLAGCTGGNADPGTGPASTSGSTSPSSGGPAEPVKISIFRWDFDTVALPGSEIAEYYREKLGIEFDVITTSYNDWETKLGLLIASDETPDLFINKGPNSDNIEQYRKWVADELLVSFTDNSAKYPNVDQVVKQYDNLTQSLGGQLYALPLKLNLESDKAVSNTHTMFIRQDWLDKLKLPMPTDKDSFYRVLKAFAQDDPDGNGAADTYGLSCTSAGDGIWWLYQVFNLFDTSFDRYEKLDGVWMPEVLNDRTKEAVRFLKQLYDEKIMDPEFMVNTEEQHFQKLLEGKLGVMLGNEVMYDTYYGAFLEAYPDKDPAAMLSYIPVMTGTTGKKRMDGSYSYYLYSSISAKAGQEKIDKIFEFLNFEMSPEGLDLLRWGIEGKHYRKEANAYVNLLPKDENGNQKSISQVDNTVAVFYLAACDVDFALQSSPHADTLIAMQEQSNAAATEDPLGFLDVPEVDPALGAKLYTEVIASSFIKLIKSSKDFDGDWEKFKQDYLAKGGQTIIDATNAAAQREGR